MADSGGYSAKVGLTLVVNGAKFALSHVAPGWVMVKDECQPLPPGDAEILIRVDESRRRRKVYLPKGVPGPRQLVPYSDAPF